MRELGIYESERISSLELFSNIMEKLDIKTVSLEGKCDKKFEPIGLGIDNFESKIMSPPYSEDISGIIEELEGDFINIPYKTLPRHDVINLIALMQEEKIGHLTKPYIEPNFNIDPDFKVVKYLTKRKHKTKRKETVEYHQKSESTHSPREHYNKRPRINQYKHSR